MTAKERAKKNAPLITGIAALLTAMAALIPQVQPKLLKLIDARAALTRAEAEAIKKANAATQLAAANQVDVEELEKKYQEIIKAQAGAIQDNFERNVALELRLTKVENRRRRRDMEQEEATKEAAQEIAAALQRTKEAVDKPRAKSKKSDPRVQAIVKNAYKEEGIELELEVGEAGE